MRTYFTWSLCSVLCVFKRPPLISEFGAGIFTKEFAKVAIRSCDVKRSLSYADISMAKPSWNWITHRDQWKKVSNCVFEFEFDLSISCNCAIALGRRLRELGVSKGSERPPFPRTWRVTCHNEFPLWQNKYRREGVWKSTVSSFI